LVVIVPPSIKNATNNYIIIAHFIVIMTDQS
jgi:hypothetical protein